MASINFFSEKKKIKGIKSEQSRVEMVKFFVIGVISSELRLRQSD
jgi:hypothetical protein